MEHDKLYVLDKTWEISSCDYVFDKTKFDNALIRPCNVDYETYRNFVLGKKVNVNTILHEGCVASWYADSYSSYIASAKTYEEFMVDANINKQAIPLFENWIFSHNWRSFTVKTIDLKTGHTLYDATSKWLSEIKKPFLI